MVRVPEPHDRALAELMSAFRRPLHGRAADTFWQQGPFRAPEPPAAIRVVPFEPFGKRGKNAAIEVANAAVVAASKSGAIKLSVASPPMPVRWSGVRGRVEKYLRDSQGTADLVVFVGEMQMPLLKESSAVRAEVVGKNRSGPRHLDNLNQTGPEVHDDGRPASASVSFGAAVAVRESGIYHSEPLIKESFDAGDYLCNAVAWHAYDLNARDPLLPTALFVHVGTEATRDSDVRETAAGALIKLVTRAAAIVVAGRP